ncbi:MAG: glycosyltransferase family 4 protein [Thermoguttaceae bacterium]|jgi:UDP-GlcNAc:undecaprenyl-phosphate GlcNAc-1-phosphate transferase
MLAVAIALIIAPFILSWATCLLIKRFGPAVGLIDKPGRRKIHASPIPTGGGLGVWVGVVLPFIALTLVALGYAAPETSSETGTAWGFSLAFCPEILTRHIGGIAARLPQLWSLLGLGTILVILGTLDDRFSLPWQLRLAVEFVVAIVAVACGWRATFFLDLPIITATLSVFWIVGLINSFNMLDNMDALSGGVATICSLFLAAVAFFFAPNPESGEPQLFLAAFLLLFASSICGFLRLNKPPAKIFMGDGGAYFIGFLLATTTLSITFVGETAPKSAIFVPVVILALPLYDTISVVTVRLHNRASPFVGDKNHYSHRLVALGLSRRQAVATVYLTTTICALGSFFLYQANFITAIAVFVQTGLILTLVAILEFTARKKIREDETALARYAENAERVKLENTSLTDSENSQNEQNK